MTEVPSIILFAVFSTDWHQWNANPSCYLKSSWSVQIISWLIAPIYWNKNIGVLYIWYQLIRTGLIFYLMLGTFTWILTQLCCHSTAWCRQEVAKNNWLFQEPGIAQLQQHSTLPLPFMSCRDTAPWVGLVRHLKHPSPGNQSCRWMGPCFGSWLHFALPSCESLITFPFGIWVSKSHSCFGRSTFFSLVETTKKKKSLDYSFPIEMLQDLKHELWFSNTFRSMKWEIKCSSKSCLLLFFRHANFSAK